MFIDVEGMLNLSADDLIGQSVAVLGLKGSGKSNTAAVLMEELLSVGVPICVVDIAGEYHSLRQMYPNVTVIGRSIETQVQIATSMENTQDLAEAAYTNGSSVVLDVSGMHDEARDEMLNAYFSKVWSLAAIHRIPTVVFLEEAHNYIPQAGKTVVKDMFVRIATEGRKRGLSLVLIGQRSTRISKDVLTQADIAFLHKVRHPVDMKLYSEIIPRTARWVQDRVNALKPGQALVLVGDRVIKCQMRMRITEHIGRTPTMDNLPQQLPLFEVWS